MADYISFRGVSTASLTGVIVRTMPSHAKGNLRVNEYYVPGRDGSLHVSEGYADVMLTCELMLIGETYDKRLVVNAWADGHGKLYTSDDTAHCWEASVIDGVQWYRDETANGFYDVARITFRCKPFMRETVESTINVSGDTTVTNIGNVVALPMIRVNGVGNCSLTVNGNEITLAGLVSGTPVYIDSAAGYVYTEAGATEMTGQFPELPLGSCTVSISGGTTSLVITPRWGWV